MFSLQEEAFGYTFYDKTKLKHRFVKSGDLSMVFEEHGISITDCDYLPIK